MRSFFIVVLSPLVGEDPYLAQRIEQVGIEHLLTIASVETLDQAVLHWLSWLTVFNLYMILFAPYLEIGRSEFRSVIYPYCFRSAPKSDQPIKFTYESSRPDRYIDHVPKSFPVEVIHYVQHSEGLSIAQ